MSTKKESSSIISIQSQGTKDFVAGTIGGFAGKLFDYPFDTIKVLLQTQQQEHHVSSTVIKTSKTRYGGSWNCLTHTIRNHGIRGLYRGLSSPLLGSMMENSVLFLSYGTIRRTMMVMNSGSGEKKEELSLFEKAIAGGCAGAIVSFVLTPVELIKCRLQVQNHSATHSSPSSSASVPFRKYRGPMDVIIRTIQEEGLIRGLYRGHISTMLREVPGNFCWYGVYEGVRMVLHDDQTRRNNVQTTNDVTWINLIGGACAGVAYWTAFYPADTVKSLIQTQQNNVNTGGISDFRKLFRMIYEREGIRGLYRGWGITVMRAAPAHAIIFATYEYVMNFLS